MHSVLPRLPNSDSAELFATRSSTVRHDTSDHLRNSSVFGGLTDSEYAIAQASCQLREFAKRDVIYFPSDTSGYTALVVRGRVRTYHLTSDGKQAILGFVDPGKLFGELSAFSGTLREEYADALEKSVVLQIPRTFMLDLMARNAGVTEKLTELFGQRVKRAERRLKSLLFGSSRERLLDFLDELASQYGVSGPNGIEIAQKISHQDMASSIGATRETVTITLGELQAEGVIEINRRRVTICRKIESPNAG